MVTEKCLAKGSAAPGPVPQDKIRIYSMRFCPFAQRTRLVLVAKGINHETVNINLKEKPDWFLAKNPLGLVPVLETSAGEITILRGGIPFRVVFYYDLHFSKVTPYFYRIPMGRRNGDDVSGLETELKDKFGKLNEDLVKKKSKFFGGDSITMIDYMMWPWFERLEALRLEHCMAGTPELKKWTERMWEDPAVKACMFSTDVYRVFMESYAAGKPDYDYGL
uniref:Glutathione S-transferase omega n=1 Tax=Acanthochromis polyacanthus TaxID=80966 RepID=A0A3Q1ERP1_9TELE